MVDFEKIKAIANSDEYYLMQLLPNAVKKGNELVCGNIYGDPGKSFSYNIRSGLWADFAGGQSGSSIIDLVALRENCTFREAAEIIDAHYNGVSNTDIKIKPQVKKPKEEEDRIISVPAPKNSHPAGYYKDGEFHKFSAMWGYNNEQGYAVAYDCRIDNEDGKKEIIPYLYNGEKWYPKTLKNNRVLYNLDRIVKDESSTVIISEGCKTADAVAKYFPNYVSTTWQGGCNAVAKADWNPIKGRKIIIIPDADDCGMKAANAIAEILCASSHSIRIVDTSSMQAIKKGWDIADALAAGMPQAEIVSFIKSNMHDFVQTNNSDKTIIDPDVVVNKPKDLYYDDTFFRCLGVQSDVHYYYKKLTSQIIEFRPSHYDSKHLINLAPLSWWQVNYPDKSGVNWVQATDDLCRLQEKVGVFDSSKIRGRGAWFDRGRTVLHLGNVLFTSGQLIDIDDFDTEYFYEKAPSLVVKVQTVLPREDATKFIKLCRMARWEKPCYGDILAGWIFSALVCGAMPFRSHLYLVGAAGTGKSWMLDNVIKRIMGNIALSVSSKSTEAGIRDALGGDIRPIIFDEAEAENQQDKLRMQAVFDLARNGSSEKSDAIVKFGAKYVCRSSFLFASINSSMSKTADMSRTAFIKLANAPVNKSPEIKKADNDKFRELESYASRLLTDEYCRCLLARAISIVPTLRQSHAIIADVAARDFGSRRLGDQMAMIIAGLWGLQSDEVIDEGTARNLIQYTSMQADKADSDEKTQEENALDHLLFSTIETQTRTGNKKIMLNLLIAVINGSELVDGIDIETARLDLSSKGIIIGTIGERQYLFLSTNRAALPAKLYAQTEWESGWIDALCRIEEVERIKSNKYFARTLVSRAVAIPLNKVITDII